MWSSKSILCGLALTGLVSLSACTVEPLNARSTATSVASSGETTSVRAALAGTSVSPANTRVAQQVRNALLFSMNGGERISGGRHQIKLITRSSDTAVAVEAGVSAATAAQVRVYSSFALIDTVSQKTIASGRRSAFASYDRTPQKFANQRAAREAENRAARDVAQQIRLAAGQALAGL